MVSAPLNLIPIEKSCYHGSKSSGSQQTVAYKYGSETEKIDKWLGCIQEQNGSSIFSSIVQ